MTQDVNHREISPYGWFIGIDPTCSQNEHTQSGSSNQASALTSQLS